VCQRARCDQLGAAGIYGRFHARQIVTDYASAGEVNESQVQRGYVAAAKEFASVRDGGKSCRICRIQAHLTPMNQHLHRKARPNPATSWPMRPKPQTPRVFPATDSPKQASGHSGNDGTLRCHWPAYKFAMYDGKRRNAASTNSQVNSEVACE